jgi:Bax protein
MTIKKAFIFVALFIGIFLSTSITFGFFDRGHELPSVHFEPLYPISKTPEFINITDTTARKEQFFNYLYPIVVFQNERILKQRITLKKLRNKFGQDILSEAETEWLTSLSKHYGLTDEELMSDTAFVKLLNRVDYLPPDLVLAQAAIESAWGTSRFATKANNYFGQWCYTKGCGLVPNKRSQHQKHEVRKFKSVDHAIYAYLNNLNSGSAYKKIRELRQKMRISNRNYIGTELAQGLTLYSQEREAYTHKVKRLIEYNKLDNFVQPITLHHL